MIDNEVRMSAEKTEADIIRDLTELEDDISQYTYLISCASECIPYPEEYRDEAHRIKECQVKTWVYSDVAGDRFVNP